MLNSLSGDYNGSEGGFNSSTKGLLLFIMLVFLFTTHRWMDYSLLDSGAEGLERGVQDIVHGSTLRRIIFSLLGLYGLTYLLRSNRKILNIESSLAWAIIFCIVWAFLSIFWSDNFSLTARRLVSFSNFCLASVAVASILSPRRIASLVLFCSMVYVVAGFIVQLHFGTFLPNTAGFRFGGSQHPNVMAMNCALGVLSTMYLADSGKEKSRLLFFGMAGFLVCLVLTKSRTSFVATMLGVLVYYVTNKKSGKRLVAMFFVFVFVAGFVVISGQSAVSGLSSGIHLGRSSENDVTLNGRIWLWQECRGYAAERKFQGYGFNSFWNPERVERISESQGWVLAGGHSVYVDLIMDLGLVGLAGFVLVLVLAMRTSFVQLRNEGDPWYAFCLAFLTFYVLHGTLESMFIHAGFPAFISMVLLASLGFSRRVSETLSEDPRPIRDWVGSGNPGLLMCGRR